ncbi:MAG: sulfatase-like hydrolase/transferase [Planctomycetota bacterium]
MKIKNCLYSCLLAALLVSAAGLASIAKAESRPNILWITSEDNGPELGCYGDSYATTPNIDGLAKIGMTYKHCWSNAPVCAPARTTIVTGLFPTSLGGQHMRSQIDLPEVCKLYPQYFRELGYYCTNNSKTDYNFNTPADQIWNESSKNAHWRNREENQPFFAVFNFTISHESKLRTRPHEAVHDASKVFVPPYHPDTPEVRQDWAQYYDRLTEMDAQVGEILAALKEDRLADNTIIFYYGDHGSGMPRGKRWLYESGLRVPLIVHVPEKLQDLVKDQYQSGKTSDRLVSFVDLVPTVLSLVGMQPPEHLHGKAFLGQHATPDPKYIYGFRDRMDERYDMSRAIRDQRFSYIRNFKPQRPQGSYLDYMFKTPTTRIWKELFDAGKLNAAQSVFWLPKASEELYDLQEDPYQVRNLAEDPQYAEKLAEMRSEIKSWMLRIRDVGLMPEGEMITRGSDSTPYDYGQSEAYPIEAIYDAADLATRPGNEDLDRLTELKEHSDATVRYWVATGCLIRPMREITATESIALAAELAEDENPFVRCLANETLARFGNERQRKRSMRQLLSMVDAEQSSTFVALTALNCLDWCSPLQSELGRKLRKLPAHDGTSAKRYNGYIPKLINRLNSIATE